MALTYPLTLAQFYDQIGITEGELYLPETLASSVDGAGNIYTDDLGDRLWMGEFLLHRRAHAEIRRAEARLSILRQAGSSFLTCDPRALAPAYDPTGAILGVSTPIINSLAGNSRDLTLAGLPSAYQITQGDRIAWTYVVSSVTKYAYHEVVTGSTASGGGVTGQIEVTPAIRAGVTVSTPVTLIRPAFKAVYVPNSLTASRGRGQQSEGLSFQFMQTLKG